MSTWWYLECMDHTPSLRSDDEVEQHTYGLPAIRELIAERGNTRAMGLIRDNGEYFQRNTARFLIRHPNCPLRLVNEYGGVEAIEDTPERTSHE